jgi:hypothetical protein
LFAETIWLNLNNYRETTSESVLCAAVVARVTAGVFLGL